MGMRIVVHGQQAFGMAVLEKLLARGENVVGVFCAPDKEGRPADPMKELALEKGLPVHQPASWKTKEAEELMRSLKPDVCIMAYVLLFVPQAVLDVPTHGTFQYHPSLLPDHRGPSSINWPIAMGKTKTGLTIFWPNEGLDEGPILLQKTVEIGPDETLGEVYFNKLFPMGVEAMIESLDLVKAGKAPRIEQDLSKGSYESWFKKDLAKLDWSKPAAEVYNVIRAAIPQPGPWTTHKGEPVTILEARKDDGAKGAPGTVLSVSADGILVAADTGGVVIKRVRAVKGDKVTAQDYAAASGLKAGDTLGA
jgi:methionyl-tRNA formyltransferase